ncbi:MAG TPA: C39 family peptidase [Candidatus Sulfotelmatobacter sp.]|jgi:ABC-type bacteriocin/lantibiotic exporter with double-glycine peptidase domain|nr:C39 family peptidase [Candidatus Sulfotelmatobacter sp.]
MKLRRILGLVLLLAVSVGLVPAAETPSLWIDVPFVPQVKNGCGSAAIAMVMDYWDKKAKRSASTAADAEKIQAALYSPAEEGIPARAMKKYFEDAGYRTFAFVGDWNELGHHLERGRPLIVSLKASGPHGPLHYVVVVGIDSARGYIYLNDPAQEKMLRVSREGFESEWKATEHWTLLAVPRSLV